MEYSVPHSRCTVDLIVLVECQLTYAGKLRNVEIGALRSMAHSRRKI